MLTVVGFNQFCLSKIEKDDSFLNITHTHRLIILVEDEHFAAEYAIRSGYIMRTEDFNTSFVIFVSEFMN